MREPAKLDNVLRGYQYTFTQDSFMSNTYYVRFKGKDTYNIFDIIDKLDSNESIIYTEPNFIRIMSPCTNDPYFQYQWAIKNTGTYYGGTVGADMDVENAWSLSTGNNVKIAIIDEGVQLDHPDLVNNLLPGYDATGNNSQGGPNISNDDAHGTNCAGIAAASANNNVGIAGVAYNAKIIPIRVAYDNSYPLNSPDRHWITQDSWLADGINYAYSKGQADILSNSWGGGSRSNTIDAAINSAVNNGRNGKGCVVLFAAGNNDTTPVQYPAINSNVIAVGASSNCDTRKSPTSCDGEYWWGSNYGTGLDIVAPGVKIYTTDLTGSHGYSSTDYNPTFNGTSSATPNAAGVAALILSLKPDYTVIQVRQILESTCDKIGGYTYQANVSGQPNGTWCSDAGYGRVNACKAVFKAVASEISVTGPSTVCTSNSTFILNNCPSGFSVNWNHSSNLTYVSGQGTNNYTVGAANSSVSGMGWVKAIVNSSCGNDTIEKDVWVGKPNFTLDGETQLDVRMIGIAEVLYQTDQYQGVTNVNWTRSGAIASVTGGLVVAKFRAGALPGYGAVYAKATNQCGSKESRLLIEVTGGWYKVYPNPVNNVLSVESISSNKTVSSNTNLNNKTAATSINTISRPVEIRIYDKMMHLKLKKTFDGKNTKINVSNLRPGIYIVQIINGKNIYKKEIIISHH